MSASEYWSSVYLVHSRHGRRRQPSDTCPEPQAKPGHGCLSTPILGGGESPQWSHFPTAFSSIPHLSAWSVSQQIFSKLLICTRHCAKCTTLITSFKLKSTLWCGYYCRLHFVNKKTQAQKGWSHLFKVQWMFKPRYAWLWNPSSLTTIPLFSLQSYTP